MSEEAAKIVADYNARAELEALSLRCLEAENKLTRLNAIAEDLQVQAANQWLEEESAEAGVEFLLAQGSTPEAFHAGVRELWYEMEPEPREISCDVEVVENTLYARNTETGEIYVCSILAKGIPNE